MQKNLENDLVSFTVLRDKDLGGGTANGYVVVPEQAFFSNMSARELSRFFDVHGGITWASKAAKFTKVPLDIRNKINPNDLIIGFDTGICSDTPQEWTVEAVKKEAEKLAAQVSYFLRAGKFEDYTCD